MKVLKHQLHAHLTDHQCLVLTAYTTLQMQMRLSTAGLSSADLALPSSTCALQGEPKFERWKAELEAPYKSPQLNPSAKQPPRTHAGMVVDHPELTEKFESLGATLRVCNVHLRALVLLCHSKVKSAFLLICSAC